MILVLAQHEEVAQAIPSLLKPPLQNRLRRHPRLDSKASTRLQSTGHRREKLPHPLRVQIPEAIPETISAIKLRGPRQLAHIAQHPFDRKRTGASRLYDKLLAQINARHPMSAPGQFHHMPAIAATDIQNPSVRAPRPHTLHQV